MPRKHIITLFITTLFFAAPALPCLASLKIYYIRHADAWHNAKDGDLQKFKPAGIGQLRAVPEKLRRYQFDFIACSPMWRCRNTILPYLRETKQTAEIWPELTEFSAELVPLFFDTSIMLPPANKDWLRGAPINLPGNETPFYKLRPGVTKSVRPDPRGLGKAQAAADCKAALEHVIALLKKRYGGTGKSILLSGHGTNGKALLQLLLRAEDRPDRITIMNAKIWMVEQQPDGAFKLRMFNDREL
jgi:broad specificity phosphatase PhoE